MGLDVDAFPEQQGVRPQGAESPAIPGVRPPGAPPLGRMLVERGLLDEEQLVAGLAEQERSGAPLGKVLIELGFVDAGTVALALATQHGGVLETEYGFATGFRTHRPSTPALEPPTSPSRPDGTGESSEPQLALGAPNAATGAPSPSSELPSPPDFHESPLAAAQPEEEQPPESSRVESEAERQGQTETVPDESDAMTPAGGAKDVAALATGIDAAENGRKTILGDRQTTDAERGRAHSAEASEAKQGIHSEEFGGITGGLDECDPAPAGRPATPEAWTSGAGEKEAPSSRPAVDSDALQAADLHGEPPASRPGGNVQLQSRIAVLEGELAAAQLAVESATADSRGAHSAAETAAARIAQLEYELAAARAGDSVLRSENGLLRAAASEQSTTVRYLQECLVVVGKRLTGIEQRLETASVQIAALEERSVSN